MTPLMNAQQQAAHHAYFNAQTLCAACADVHRAVAVNARVNNKVRQQAKEAHRLALCALHKARESAEAVGLRYGCSISTALGHPEVSVVSNHA